MTSEQIQEPLQNISDYFSPDSEIKQELSQEEKKALITKILEKVFCTNTQSNGQLHDEYLKILPKLLVSAIDRDLLIQQLQWRFSGEYYFSQLAFENLEKVIRKIYDSFADQLEASDEFVPGGIEIVKSLSKRYFRRNQTKNIRYAQKASASLSLD